MNKRPLVILAAVLAILLASCSQGGKTGLLVPKDAAFVVHVNMKSLSSKLSWEEIKQSEWFKKMPTDTNDSLAQQMLNDPSSSGVDLNDDIVLFLARHNGSGYASFSGGIKDAAAFENFLQKSSKGNLQITADGDLKFASMNEQALLSWNKEQFLIVGNAPFDNMGRRGWGGEDYGPRLISPDSLKLLSKQILALKGDKLLDSDKRFASLVAETGDMHVWVNSEAFASNALGLVSGIMKVGMLIEDNVSTATVNFDNGKITIAGNQYFSDELTSFLKKNSPKTIDKDLINRLPSGNVMAAGVFNYPPEGLKEFVKLIGADGMANGFMREYNYSIEEFVSANKGDIAFAVADFAMSPDTIRYEGIGGKTELMVTDRPDVNFVAATSVGNKEAFGKMIAIMQQQMKGMDQLNPDVEYDFGNDWFVVGSNKGNIESFKNGQNTPAYADKLSGHQAGFFLNVNAILAKVKALSLEQGKSESETFQEIMDASIAFWQDVVVNMDVKDGKVSSYSEINLVDKNTNSLKQLNNYLGNMATRYLMFDGEPVSVDVDVKITPDTTQP